MLYELLESSADTVGIIGVVILLIAYFLLSTNKLSAHSLAYQVSNFLGAAFILYSLMFHFNLASFLIEISWIFISLIGIYRVCKTNKQLSAESDNLYKLSDVKKKLS